ncbi:MAG: pyridoxal phosphate-dependent aminotransferase [Thermodesulfobacteriota bacterium]
MQFSDRINSVSPSATLTINSRAAELRSKGRDVVSLAAGEPDFAPPENVMQAMKKAVDNKHTGYTPVPGIPELLSAISGYFSFYYGVEPENRMLTTTNGGKQGLYNLMQILLNPGDEVLIPGPYWVSYPDMVKLAGGTPVIVPSGPERDFQVDPSLLQESISSNTKVLVLNSPSNPTGSHYSQKDLDAILDWAVSRDLFVISDEIYDQLVYAPATQSSAVKWFEAHPENVAIVNGLSKSFAMTGIRVGFVMADPRVIANLNKLQGQSTSNICTIAQYAALEALQGPHDFLQESRQLFSRRRDRALGIIQEWSGVNCPRPDGAFYLFPEVSSLYNEKIQDSTQMCTYLLEQAGVALVPGIAFGDDTCVRISYALDEKTLVSALQKVEQAFSDL